MVTEHERRPTMAEMPEVHLTDAAKVMVKWLDEKPLNPEATGPLIELWMSLFGFGLDSDEPDYEDGMMQAVGIAFDLADPPPEPQSTVVVTDVIVQGEVL